MIEANRRIDRYLQNSDDFHLWRQIAKDRGPVLIVVTELQQSEC